MKVKQQKLAKSEQFGRVVVHLAMVWWLLVQLFQAHSCFPTVINNWAEVKTKISVTSKLHKKSDYGKDSSHSKDEAVWSSTEPFRLAWL